MTVGSDGLTMSDAWLHNCTTRDVNGLYACISSVCLFVYVFSCVCIINLPLNLYKCQICSKYECHSRKWFRRPWE